MNTEQRKLLNDIDLKTIGVQAADLRHADAATLGISAFVVSIGGALGAASLKYGSEGRPGQAFCFALLVLLVGIFAITLGYILFCRMETAIQRAERTRERLIKRSKLPVSLAADLGNWFIPDLVARRYKPVPWALPIFLQGLGGFIVLGGIVLAFQFLEPA